MTIRKKIIFILPSMEGGGSERVVSILVKHLSREKFDIILVLLRKKGQYLDDLPNDITIIDLNVNAARFAVFKIINIIRKLNPDIVFSTLGHLNILISILKPFLATKIKFIARESSIVSLRNNQKYPTALFDLLYKTFYNNFDWIICQSNYMMNDLHNHYKIKKEKMIVINNPVDIENINQLSKESDNLLFEKEKINLLAVGRLEKVKGYDLLLRTLSELNSSYHLTIIGEGSEENILKALARTLNVENQINFLGFQKNPYQYMRQADLCILSSQYEGFPNVVLEANVCGTPVVAFECPGGTAEIIENGINGFLVECENIKELRTKIEYTSLYKFDKNKIINMINYKYNVDFIIKKYECIFL
ncbi:MAG: glycosyltransferase [Epsilonproteobacteria bacterium]|nr:MAG: glycosyltransferase [Campylobacterota bacterium]